MLQNTPQVVKNLIILNVLMYFGSGLLGDAAVPLLAGTYPGSPFFQPWQLVTHMFMHGDLGHIFFNMFAFAFAPGHWAEVKNKRRKKIV